MKWSVEITRYEKKRIDVEADSAVEAMLKAEDENPGYDASLTSVWVSDCVSRN